jgi:hypothetical protein
MTVVVPAFNEGDLVAREEITYNARFQKFPENSSRE